jgi:hypothetical protein
MALRFTEGRQLLDHAGASFPDGGRNAKNRTWQRVHRWGSNRNRRKGRSIKRRREDLLTYMDPQFGQRFVFNPLVKYMVRMIREARYANPKPTRKNALAYRIRINPSWAVLSRLSKGTIASLYKTSVLNMLAGFL